MLLLNYARTERERPKDAGLKQSMSQLCCFRL